MHRKDLLGAPKLILGRRGDQSESNQPNPTQPYQYQPHQLPVVCDTTCVMISSIELKVGNIEKL